MYFVDTNGCKDDITISGSWASLEDPEVPVNHLISITRLPSPPLAQGTCAFLYHINGFSANFSWALCSAAKVSMIPELEKAVDKSTKVRYHPHWKLFVKWKLSLTICDSFIDALTKILCHRLTEDMRGKDGQKTCSFAQSCVWGGGSGGIPGVV